MSSNDSVSTKIGQKVYPLEIGYLPECFLEKAEIELNYTTAVREKTLKELKDMMNDDDSMKSVRLEDELLLMFLNSRKYDVKRSFIQLKKFITFKRKNIDSKIRFENISPVLEVISILPVRCQDGCAIIIAELDKWKLDKHPVEFIKQFYLVLLTMSLREPMTQVNGFKAIFDLHATTEVLRVCTPHNLYLLYYGTQVVLPARTKEVHLINVGIIGRSIYQMSKIFLPEKLKNRIHVHATTESLLKYFPKSVVPRKFGGDLKDHDMTDWLKRKTTPEELAFVNVE